MRMSRAFFRTFLDDFSRQKVRYSVDFRHVCASRANVATVNILFSPASSGEKSKMRCENSGFPGLSDDS